MAHENLKRDEHIEGSSDRVFGLVLGGGFLVVGIWPLLHGKELRWWSVALAAMFALAAMINPAMLAGLNRLWTKLGVLLGKVVSPIALGILFYGILTPVGAIIRSTGKDPLRLKFDPDAESYWIPREPPGPPPGSMNNQF